jgi:PPM family protein phosphatase
MNISFALLSEPGPRSKNEDYLDCWIAPTGETLACIADGLGGMGGGDIASRLAVKEFRRFLASKEINTKSMIEATRSAHEAIKSAQGLQQMSRMATTFTALAILEHSVLGVHCGDTRATIARRNGIKRLTKDHSEGQRLFEAGKLTKEELATYPRKHILESALGDSDYPRIETFNFDLELEDRIFLTTDGVHNLVRLKEMQRLSSQASTPFELVKNVSSEIQSIGPTDNYSMLVVYLN